MSAQNLNINANTITTKDAVLLADESVNLKANNHLGLTSSKVSANNINLQANKVNINQSSDTKSFSGHTQTTLTVSSNLDTKNDININLNDILISVANLKADEKHKYKCEKRPKYKS